MVDTDPPVTNERPIRVFILDDHELVRRGLTDLLTTTDDLIIVGEAATAADALHRDLRQRQNRRRQDEEHCRDDEELNKSVPRAPRRHQSAVISHQSREPTSGAWRLMTDDR